MRRHTSPTRHLTIALLVLGALFTFEIPTYAYLDPGSGSMLLQVLLGGFAAAGVIAKLYWHRLTAVFRRNEPKQDGHQ